MNEELDDTYKAVFRQCYPKLLFYATRLVGTEEAEDVVQDVFVELWRRRDSVVIGEQILAFLYRSVYTKAINLLKHQVIENNYSAAMIEIYERNCNITSRIMPKSLKDRESGIASGNFWSD